MYHSTMHKKHTLLVTTTRQLLWPSQSLKKLVEDNLYDRLASRYTRALARSMAHTKQVKAAAVLNNAFSAGAFAGGDGVALCATDHPLTNGGTFANEPAVAADLNETSLEDALISIAGFTDERGLIIALKGMKLIIPRQLAVCCRASACFKPPGWYCRQRHQRNQVFWSCCQKVM